MRRLFKLVESSRRPGASAAVKQSWIEEPVDRYVNRPLAGWLVRSLLSTQATPNQVTVAAGFFGLLAAALILMGTSPALGLAAVCLAASIVCDCADGQLARALGSASRFGRLLDGAADYVTSIALHLGVWSYLAASHSDDFRIFVWVVLAGVSMALHAAFYDYRKQWFLARQSPRTSQRDDPEQLRRELDGSDGVLVRSALQLYLAYTRLQERLGGYGAVRTRARNGPNEERREAVFPGACRPFLRLLGWLGPTTHITLILLATAMTPFFDTAFWWYLLAVTVPMNVLFIVLFFWGRRLDDEFPA